MDLTVLILLGSGLFLGWSLGANDAANVIGTAVGTRMVRFATAAAVCSVFVILGAVISGGGAALTLGELGSINALAGAFMAALASAVTVYGMTRSGLPVSTSQAIVGAIIGWNLFSDSVTDLDALARILLTWVACPLLAGLIAVVVLRLVKQLLNRARLHLLRLDAYTRVALIAAGAFGAYSLGANNIANVMGVFVPVNPFTDFSTGEWTITAVQQLFLLGGIAIAVGVFTYSKRVMMTVGNELMPMSPVTAWVVVVAHSIVLFVFASQGLEHWLAVAGLPTIPLVPVSSSQAVIGAVVGLGLLQGGGRRVRWSMLGQIGAGWVTTPFLSALVCFVGLFFLQNVFDQKVYEPQTYRITPAVVRELERNGVAENVYERLVGRSFASGRALLATLEAQTPASAAERDLILEVSALRRLFVNDTKLSRLDLGRFSAAQLDALRQLEGQRYDYVWQLRRALAFHSDEWRALPDKPGNRRDNKRLHADITYLSRLLAEPVAPRPHRRQ